MTTATLNATHESYLEALFPHSFAFFYLFWNTSSITHQTCVYALNRQWLLTAGAQDVLRSWRHGLDTVLTQTVLPVKGHSVPGRERPSGSGVTSTIGQRDMSCGPEVSVRVYQLWLPGCLMGLKMTGPDDVDVSTLRAWGGHLIRRRRRDTQYCTIRIIMLVLFSWFWAELYWRALHKCKKVRSTQLNRVAFV